MIRVLALQKMKKIMICLAVLLTGNMAGAQQPKNIFFHWNAGNSNYPAYFMAEKIAQEQNGILWLGGREGLLRFDGYHFQPFRSQVFDSTTIPGNFIASLLIDKNYLYGGTFSTGFFVMDLQSFKVKRIPLLGKAAGSKFTASAIAIKNKDSLWVACSKKQLLRIHKKTFQPDPSFTLKPLPGNAVDSGTIFTIQPAKNIPGKIWLITNNSILLADAKTGWYNSYRFTAKSETGETVALDNPTCIAEETDSTALVGFFKRGIIQWNFRKNTWKHFLFKVDAPRITNNIINQFISKAPNEYFVASSDSGLYVFNSLTGQFTKDAAPASKEPDLFREAVRNLFADKHGGIWLNSIGAISYWHPAYQGVTAYSTPAPLAPTVASSVQDYNKNIVITRRDAKHPLAIFDADTRKWLPVKNNDRKDEYVRIKIPFRNNYIYQGINANWFQYNNQAQELQPFAAATTLLNTEKNINGFDEDDSRIVYSSRNGVYICDKKNGVIQHHSSSEIKDSLHVKITTHVKLDKHNNAWFASLYGLAVYNFNSKQFKELSFRTNRQWPGLRVIADLQLSKTGLLYAATQDDGVYVFDTQTRELVAHYNKDYLLHENFVNNILLDSTQQYLWVATLSGLNVIDLRHQYSKRWDKHNSGLSIADGFFGLTVLNNNEVYCADSVLYNFDMGSFKKIDLKPFVSGYSVRKNYYNATGNIQLDKEINYLELFISTGFFADAAHTSIQYRLSGKEEWNEVENGKIIIPSLKNGETNVQLRASMQGIFYGDGETVITVNRAMYYYQAWWFKALLIVLVAALTYLLFSSRIKQVRKQERERALLHGKINELEIASLRSQMNPHFIFNTLSSLRYLVLTGDNKKAAAFILKLSKLLRMILSNSGEAIIPLQDELEALQLYLEVETLRFDNGFSHSISIDPQAETFDIKLPPMLLQPFVENAIKHGLTNSTLADKWVKIFVENNPDNTISFIIADNGIGRSNASLLHASSKHRSMGTQLTNQRIELFNKTSGAHISCRIADYCSDQTNPGTVVELIYQFKDPTQKS